MKYIDAEKLKARIQFLIDSGYNNLQDSLYYALSIIASLQHEQPEVDLEKEYTEFVESDPVYSKLVNSIVGKSIARHFYELGLNARKK